MGWLKGARGIIHVGANLGQERDAYAKLGLRVLWIEPIPSIFEQLTRNIRDFARQDAIKALVTNEHGKTFQFNVASNTGASSSIYEFAMHKDVWPNIEYVEQLEIESTTLSKLIEDHSIPMEDYDAMLIDTQGSELMVLEGAEGLLPRIRLISVEAADFESYEGGCQISDIVEFLTARGFSEKTRKCFARRKEGGAYYDMIWENTRIPSDSSNP